MGKTQDISITNWHSSVAYQHTKPMEYFEAAIAKSTRMSCCREGLREIEARIMEKFPDVDLHDLLHLNQHSTFFIS